jgi:hypothetical protein
MWLHLCCFVALSDSGQNRSGGECLMRGPITGIPKEPIEKNVKTDKSVRIIVLIICLPFAIILAIKKGKEHI